MLDVCLWCPLVQDVTAENVTLRDTISSHESLINELKHQNASLTSTIVTVSSSHHSSSTIERQQTEHHKMDMEEKVQELEVGTSKDETHSEYICGCMSNMLLASASACRVLLRLYARLSRPILVRSTIYNCPCLSRPKRPPTCHC